MKKPVLGVDIDGTLANTIEVFLKRLRLDYGVKLSKEQITDYDITKFVPITRVQMGDIWAQAWHDHEQIKLEDKNAPDVLKNLKRQFEIHIVTATNAQKGDLAAWLFDKQIPYDKIWHFEGQINKINSKVDIHIDDSFEVAKLFVENKMKVILIEQPWNKKYHGLFKNEKLVSIARNWKDIERKLVKA